MIRAKTENSILALLYKPLCVLLLLFGLFGLIWLRSSFVALSYDLRNIEEKNSEALKENKTLLADRAKLLSLVKLDGASRNASYRGGKYEGGYVFPDRRKVIYVRKNKGPEPYKASFEVEGRE